MVHAVSCEPPRTARRLKVLISAYACEPERGSEPGVGWNVVVQAARRHDVWAVTRSNNREVIEAELARNPVPGLHMVYYDLPRWMRWWKNGTGGTRLYYYLWQLALYSVVRRLYRKLRFDVTHHVTFVKYWMPTPLPFLPAPFLWGPVGGGEVAPRSFQADCGWRARLFERLRSAARGCAERDPLVLAAARRSAMALAVTQETAQRLRAIGAEHVEILSQLGLSAADRSYLGAINPPAAGDPVRFLSLGNMLQWKGFHLGLRAFAAANLPRAEYWLVGDGPYRARLQHLARGLGIEEKVHFWGSLPRAEALVKLGQCHVLVHPSLHDSGAWVCMEAMAAAKPVICLDLGGPGAQVTGDTGFKIPACTPGQVVKDMARAMAALADDSNLRARMGRAGKDRVASNYAWERKGEVLSQIYRGLARRSPVERLA